LARDEATKAIEAETKKIRTACQNEVDKLKAEVD
jgi:hypothetical protein